MTEQEYNSALKKIILFQAGNNSLRIRVDKLDIFGKAGNITDGSIKAGIKCKDGAFSIPLLDEFAKRPITCWLGREIDNIRARQNLNRENSFKYILAYCLTDNAAQEIASGRIGFYSKLFLDDTWKRGLNKHYLKRSSLHSVENIVETWRMFWDDPVDSYFSYTPPDGTPEIRKLPFSVLWGLVPGETPIDLEDYRRLLMDKTKTWSDIEQRAGLTRPGIIKKLEKWGYNIPRRNLGPKHRSDR